MLVLKIKIIHEGARRIPLFLWIKDVTQLIHFKLPAQLRNTLITYRHIIYPILLLLRVSENVLSQTIKAIKMEVNWIKGSDVSFVTKSLPSHREWGVIGACLFQGKSAYFRWNGSCRGDWVAWALSSSKNPSVLLSWFLHFLHIQEKIINKPHN